MTRPMDDNRETTYRPAMEFTGAKLVLLVGRDIVTIRRDDRADIPWPGLWDLPGGGRDGHETPEACVLRETVEEIGLRLPVEAFAWRRFYATPNPAWLFAARLAPGAEAAFRLGDEGQEIALMNPAEWVLRDDIIPHFRVRVADAMEALLGG